MPKKIILTGATGLIGKYLFRELKSRGEEVIIFSRNLKDAEKILPDAKEYIKWDFSNPASWENTVEGKDAVIHLAGATIGGRRWTERTKKEIIYSRINSTRALVNAIKKAVIKPEILICASGVGYYGTSTTDIFSEQSPAGNDFLADVCKQWEYEAEKVEDCGVRRISIRTGLVLEKNEGALGKMLLLYKFFVGGSIGSGKQWLSWIHIHDVVNIYLRCIEDRTLHGAINTVAPNPVRMKEFAIILGGVLNRPAKIRVPEFVLKIVFGESADIILKGQKVIPEKILSASFQFKFTHLKEALENLFMN